MEFMISIGLFLHVKHSLMMARSYGLMSVYHTTKPKTTSHPFKPVMFRIGEQLLCGHPVSFINDAHPSNVKQIVNCIFVTLAYVAWKMSHTTMGTFNIGEKEKHHSFPPPTPTIWKNYGQFDTCPAIGSSTLWHFGCPLCTSHWRNAYHSRVHFAMNHAVWLRYGKQPSTIAIMPTCLYQPHTALPWDY